MLQFKYLAYLAVVCAVLLDLYSAKPDTSAVIRACLDTVALVFAAGGLLYLAMGSVRDRKS